MAPLASIFSRFRLPVPAARAIVAWMVFALSLCLSGGPSRAQTAASDAGVSVEVERRGETVYVDASLLVPVDVQLAWQVMTDYERMPEFLPQLLSSRILSRDGNRLRLVQDGRVFIGPIPWSFEYVRDVELTPVSRIRSVIVGGSLASGEAVTELTTQRDGTLITYRGEGVPGVWVPLGISEAVIRHQIREQLGRMRMEMLRRQGAR